MKTTDDRGGYSFAQADGRDGSLLVFDGQLSSDRGGVKQNIPAEEVRGVSTVHLQPFC
jgi:hypothetical protein